MSSNHNPSRFKMRDYSRSVLPSDPKAAHLFDELFRSHGGLLTNRWKYSESTQWYRMRYWDYLHQMKQYDDYGDRLKSIYWDFIDNPGLNAVTLKRAPYTFIGVYGGTVQNIVLLFKFLLSHPSVFPYIGESVTEKVLFEDLSFCNWTGSALDILVRICPKGGFPDFWPQDAERQVTAFKLATLAIDFLFFHEIGHVANMHADYSKADSASEIVQERESLDEKDFLRDQVLELEADGFATQFTTTVWYLTKWPNDTPFSSLLEVLTMWIVAVGSLFLLFDRSRAQIQDYSSSKHPHPAVRLLHLLSCLRMTAQSFSDSAVETLRMAQELGIENLANTWKIFGMESAIWAVLDSAESSVPTEYARLMDYYQKIWVDLERVRKKK